MNIHLWKKVLVSALALVLGIGIGTAVLANYEIRQLEDGHTEWTDPDAARRGGSPDVRVGRQYLTVRVTNPGIAATHFLVSPISGALFSAFAVQNSSPVNSMTTTLTFGVMVPVSPAVFLHPTTGGWIYLRPTQAMGYINYNRPGTSAQVGGTPGGRLPSEVTRMQASDPVTMRVRQGGIISIAVGGEAPDTCVAGCGEYDIIIIIDPR